MPVLAVPAPLRRQLGEEATDSLVALLNAAGDSTRDNVIEVASERFERRLAEEVAKLDRRITEEIAGLRVHFERRLTEEIAGLRVELARNRTDLIRWMFAFWIGQTVVTATLFTLLRQAF